MIIYQRMYWHCSSKCVLILSLWIIILSYRRSGVLFITPLLHCGHSIISHTVSTIYYFYPFVDKTNSLSDFRVELFCPRQFYKRWARRTVVLSIIGIVVFLLQKLTATARLIRVPIIIIIYCRIVKKRKKLI